MGLGRTTRFAPLPPGAVRVSVMRRGTAGIRDLAPSPKLLAAFESAKAALVKAGVPPARAHVEACRQTDYRARYLAEIRGSGAARRALREVVDWARRQDVFLMCMCPYATPERACHTYLLLDLARELDPKLRLLPEPAPRSHRSAARRRPPG
jgi:Protein of unknown function, DUF488